MEMELQDHYQEEMKWGLFVCSTTFMRVRTITQ